MTEYECTILENMFLGLMGTLGLERADLYAKQKS